MGGYKFPDFIEEVGIMEPVAISIGYIVHERLIVENTSTSMSVYNLLDVEHSYLFAL